MAMVLGSGVEVEVLVNLEVELVDPRTDHSVALGYFTPVLAQVCVLLDIILEIGLLVGGGVGHVAVLVGIVLEGPALKLLLGGNVDKTVVIGTVGKHIVHVVAIGARRRTSVIGKGHGGTEELCVIL